MPIVLNPVVDTTRTIAFDAMVDDMSAFLPGCPTPTIARIAKKIITDLCQRGKVWQEDLVQQPLAVNQLNYAPISPFAYAVCTDVTQAYTVVAGEKRDLTLQKYASVQRYFPNWPDNEPGAAQFFTARTVGEILLAPVPDVAGTLYTRGYLRPSATADVWDADLYDEFSREVFHGVLHELMLMPNRSWTDQKLAMVHGKQWTYLLSCARIRATKAYNVDDTAVEMRPFA